MSTKNKIIGIIALAIILPLIPGLMELCFKIDTYATGIFIVIAILWVALWIIAGILKLLVVIKERRSGKETGKCKTIQKARNTSI